MASDRPPYPPIDGYTHEDLEEITALVARALVSCTRAQLDLPPGRQTETILRYLWTAGFLVRRARGGLRLPPGTQPTTLGGMAAIGRCIKTSCRACGQSGRDIDPAALIPRFGDDFAVLALSPLLRCSHCGVRGAADMRAGIKQVRAISTRSGAGTRGRSGARRGAENQEMGWPHLRGGPRREAAKMR